MNLMNYCIIIFEVYVGFVIKYQMCIIIFKFKKYCLVLYKMLYNVVNRFYKIGNRNLYVMLLYGLMLGIF